MNNSLIDFLVSSKCALSFSEKQYTNTAFFGTYLFSVLLSFLLSKLGYKVSAILSLLIVGLGFVFVYWMVRIGYLTFLASMFCVALGVVFLQIVLNPYVLGLGKPEEVASRLNLVVFLFSYYCNSSSFCCYGNSYEKTDENILLVTCSEPINFQFLF